MPRTVDQRIHRLAATQHGVVTRPQLLEAGVSRRQVEWRIRSGALIPLHRGVYLPGALEGPLRPQLAPEMAAVLACGHLALISHRSAARLWGLLPGRRSEIEVITPAGVRRERPGLRVHRSRDLAPSDRAGYEGIPITSAARTLRDLSSVVGTNTLARAIGRAEREGLIGPDELATLVARQRTRPGGPALRAVAGPARDGVGDGGETGRSFTRSDAERRFLDLVRSAGLPTPATNVEVLGHEVDFLWREARLVVEVDGFRYHASRPAFENDRRRDARLLGGGYRVMRLSWRQIVDGPRPTLVALTRALDRAG